MFKCKFAKELWRELMLEEDRGKLEACQSAMEVIKYIVSLKAEKMVMITTSLWIWWGERNKVREGEQRRDTSVLAHIIRRTAHDYAQAYIKEKQSTFRVRQTWRCPTGDVIKLNTDGACGGDTHMRLGLLCERFSREGDYDRSWINC